MKRKLLYSLTILAFVLVIIFPVQANAKARISKKSVTLTVGQKAKLKINGTKKKVGWKSKNKSVAAVNKKGKVMAKSPGKTKIIATVGAKKYKCKVIVKKNKNLDFDGSGYPKIGNGNIYITTSGGTSENGNIPTEFIDKDLLLTSIRVNCWDTDRAKLGYVYIDGMLKEKNQLGDVQFNVYLTSNDFKKGIHTVEVVAYDNNKQSGKVVLYRKMKYRCVPE